MTSAPRSLMIGRGEERGGRTASVQKMPQPLPFQNTFSRRCATLCPQGGVSRC